MKPPNASDFPALHRVFTGYLHEDFGQVHGTPAAALRAFMADADPSERRRVVREIKRFLERTGELNDADVSTLVADLGARWTPPSREALVALLIDATKPTV